MVPEVRRDEDVGPGPPYVVEEVVARTAAHRHAPHGGVEVPSDPYARRGPRQGCGHALTEPAERLGRREPTDAPKAAIARQGASRQHVESRFLIGVRCAQRTPM